MQQCSSTSLITPNCSLTGRTRQCYANSDENYAREFMQLFTIGLWKLNKDGTSQLDENGQRIPTYSNEDVMTFARSWTGFDDQPVIALPLGLHQHYDCLFSLSR